MPKLTLQHLEAHLWIAACVLRGRTAGQGYKTYILSPMFFKRLSGQWDHEAVERVRGREAGREVPFTPKQWERPLTAPGIHRFAIPDGCHGKDVIAADKDHGACSCSARTGRPPRHGAARVRRPALRGADDQERPPPAGRDADSGA